MSDELKDKLISVPRSSFIVHRFLILLILSIHVNSRVPAASLPDTN